MKKTYKDVLFRDIWGKKVIRIGNYEINKRDDGFWIIDRLYPYSRGRAWYGMFFDTPTFPNMMQAYRFLKEHWSEMV